MTHRRCAKVVERRVPPTVSENVVGPHHRGLFHEWADVRTLIISPRKQRIFRARWSNASHVVQHGHGTQVTLRSEPNRLCLPGRPSWFCNGCRERLSRRHVLGVCFFDSHGCHVSRDYCGSTGQRTGFDRRHHTLPMAWSTIVSVLTGR